MMPSLQNARPVLLVLALAMTALPATAQTPLLEIDYKNATVFHVLSDGKLLMPLGAASGYVLTTDAAGNAAWMPPPAGSFSLPFSGTHSASGDAFTVTVDNVAAGSAGVFQNVNAGNGEPPLVTRTNSIAGAALLVEATGGAASAALRAVSNGTAARFEGDVEITDNLSCTGCIEGNDVDPLGGIYAGKSALYVSENTVSAGANSCTTVTASCNDANDMPLQGFCKPRSGRDAIVRWRDVIDWDSLTNPAAFTCEICNEEGFIEEINAGIVCISVN